MAEIAVDLADDMTTMNSVRQRNPLTESKEMTATEQISEATIQRDKAASALSRAFDALCEAQNLITNVEAKGSADLYDKIADAYQLVSALRSKVKAMQPTGLFE